MRKKMSVRMDYGELREIETQLRQFYTQHKTHSLPIQPREGFYCGHYRKKDFRRIVRLAKKIDKFCRTKDPLDFQATTENMRYMRDVMSVYDEWLEDKVAYYKNNNLDYGDRKGLKQQIKRAEKILYKLPNYGEIDYAEAVYGK